MHVALTINLVQVHLKFAFTSHIYTTPSHAGIDFSSHNYMMHQACLQFAKTIKWPVASLQFYLP